MDYLYILLALVLCVAVYIGANALWKYMATKRRKDQNPTKPNTLDNM